MKTWFSRYWFVLPVGILLGLLPFLTPYRSLASEMLIFAIFALGYDIVLGYTGLLSFGHAMFFGIGAYGTALVLLKLIPSLFAGLVVSTTVALAVAYFVGFLSIKRRGIYFVMITLAFCQMLYFIAFKWTGLPSAPWTLTTRSLFTFSSYSCFLSRCFWLSALLILPSAGWSNA
jgi:branched-chain amino acid transport system permease protein